MRSDLYCVVASSFEEIQGWKIVYPGCEFLRVAPGRYPLPCDGFFTVLLHSCTATVGDVIVSTYKCMCLEGLFPGQMLGHSAPSHEAMFSFPHCGCP